MEKKKVKLCVAIIIFSVIIMIISAICNRYNGKQKIRNKAILGEIHYRRKISEQVDQVCLEKEIIIRKKIRRIVLGSEASVPIITNPNEQLRKIVWSINTCLVDFMKRPNEEFAFKDF